MKFKSTVILAVLAAGICFISYFFRSGHNSIDLILGFGMLAIAFEEYERRSKK